MWTFVVILITAAGLQINHTPPGFPSQQQCDEVRVRLLHTLEQQTWRTLYVGPCEPSYRHREDL